MIKSTNIEYHAPYIQKVTCMFRTAIPSLLRYLLIKLSK